MRILIDNGHGIETPGKRSPVWPDKSQLLEYKYAREIAQLVAAKLKKLGLVVDLIVPEENDIPLTERCKRVNKIASIVGAKNCLLISIHANASDTNAEARGWEIHTFTGQSISDVYATVFWKEAEAILKQETKMRGDWSDKDPDYDSNFAMLRDTVCPSVLTENLFMTNDQDCKFLLSAAGKKAVVDLHVNAIVKIANLS